MFWPDDEEKHRIGWFGSIALIINNISGPGLLDFPAAYQESGWLPATTAILVIASASAFVATTLVDAMRLCEHVGERLEFSAIFGRIFGRKTFVITQFLYLANLFSQNVAAIVSTAQATDALIATLVGRGFALDLERGFVSWHASTTDTVPFDDDSTFLLTFGYAFCFLTLFPLGCMNLEDNMLAQKASFLILTALCLYFVTFWLGLAKERQQRVPAVGTRYRDLVGVCLFNFAFCVTVPAWRNEKSRRVNATSVIWISCLASAFGYAVVGYCGAMAYKHASDNVLDDLTSPMATYGARLAGGLFAWAIIGLGVPVFAVLMRYNLLSGTTAVSPRLAMFVSAWLPWLLAWLLYHGHGILALLDWSGLILDSAVDFLLPIAAALAVTTKVAQGYGSIIQQQPPKETADTRPLPARLMPYYAPIKLFVLFFVTFLVFVGLVLQIHFLLRSLLVHRRHHHDPVPDHFPDE